MLDLDFGASPNLFRDASGRLVLGDLQKAGVYHAVYTDQMTSAWQTTVSVPCFSCNATSGCVRERPRVHGREPDRTPRRYRYT